jgi:hypothetical protein
VAKKAPKPEPVQRVAYRDNPIMAQAWLGCISWASQHEEICARFAADTGHRVFWKEQRAPINAMIDKATGYERTVIDAFVDWVNANLWGEDPFAGG